MIICAGLFGDEARVRFVVRLPSEVHDIKSVYLLEAAPGSREIAFFNEASDGAKTTPWNATE